MSESQPTVAVLTALPLEYRAVRGHLTDLRKREHHRGTRAEVGRLPGTEWSVALVELGEGNLTAAALTERVMAWLEPEAVFFVGVAGGLKSDIALGDVVVATKVYAVHGGKETEEGFFVRPEAWRASHRLAAAARDALRDDPRAHLKPIAAGDVVLAAARSALAEHLRKYYNDAAAIEMEGAGVASAVDLAGGDALVVRGISDRADGGKSRADGEGWQPRAAASAATAVVAVLRELRPFRGRVSWDARGAEDPEEGPHSGSTYAADHPDSGDHLGFRETTSTGRSSPSKWDGGGTGNRADDSSGRGPVHGPVPVATAALPAVPTGFTGRDDDLAELLPILDPAAESDLPVLICAVSGLGGIGKTSLALYATRRAVRDGWFPGGTLFVDFRGYDEDPVTADQALLALLDGLGVRGADLPQTPAGQYALYQRLLAEERRSMLLLFDNASNPAQFTPLIPGTDHHRVLITSRDRLTALDARLLDLDVLKPEAAADLVARSLRLTDGRDDRFLREPKAVAELGVLCGHHPLALRIAVGMLRERRHRSIASLVEELRGDGDRTRVLGVRPVFEAAYGQLRPEQARLLRLLALAPTAEVSGEAAVALTELSDDRTSSLLEGLAAAHLVTPVPVAGGEVRWRLHDLVRAFGVGVVAGDAGLREEGDAARERLLAFYCRWADAADDRLRWLPGWKEPERFTDRGQALAWLDGERAGLVAAVQWAREERYAQKAVWLAVCLAEYLEWRRYFDDWITVASTAREAAHRTGDRPSEANAWTYLGLALREAGRAEEAINAHTRARDMYQAAEDRHGEGTAWNNLGLALRKAGRAEEAINAHTRARNMYQAAGDRHGEGRAWNNLGLALREAGRAEEAINAHTRARDLHQAAEDHQREGRAWNNLGLALLAAGRTEEAIEAYGKDLEICREFEDWYGAGRTLENLALAHEDADRPAEARAHYLQSADAYTRANAPTEAADVQSAADALT